MADSPLPLLYSFRRCPYAMRARLALAVSGRVFVHREVDLKERPDELRAVSPKATVPVLVLPDGRVIEESLEIMAWALDCEDPARWLPQDDEERLNFAALTGACDGDFKFNLDRYKYSNRYEGANGLEHRSAAASFLTDLDQRLGHSPFLFASSPRLPDMAIAPFVRQFCFADEAWFRAQPWVNLLRWLDDFLKSGLFAKIMIKRAQWLPGSEPLLIDWAG
jgi:glutathione S-transferase